MSPEASLQVFSFLKITLKHFLSYKLLRSITVLLFHDEVSGLSICVASCGWDWSGKSSTKYTPS